MDTLYYNQSYASYLNLAWQMQIVINNSAAIYKVKEKIARKCKHTFEGTKHLFMIYDFSNEFHFDCFCPK